MALLNRPARPFHPLTIGAQMATIPADDRHPAPAPRPRGDRVPRGAARLLLVPRAAELDSLLACRRVAAHLTDLRIVSRPRAADPDGAAAEQAADVALVCDDGPAAGMLLDRGVPVVWLRSGHDHAPGSAGCPGDRTVRRVHRPGWLPPSGSTPDGAGGALPVGTLAPLRLTRSRRRGGTLLLLSFWGVPDDEAAAFAREALPGLTAAAVRHTGGCTVVHDRAGPPVRAALEAVRRPGRHAPAGRLPGLPAAPDAGGGVTVHRAADVDVDAWHAAAEAFWTSPTLCGLALARARGSPVALLPPLGDAQRDLAARLSARTADPRSTGADAAAPEAPGEPGEPGEPRGPRGPRGSFPAGIPARFLPESAGSGAAPFPQEPDPEDLRGAQRVARALRQLAFAPL
ncbi:CGA synthase-related protein [Streptomyces qinglanensis]|uniref:CGA synthase-related protein n=1 Tax=Streptomyces qinglanensis TaxID=943816 RepID=UPI00379AF367